MDAEERAAFLQVKREIEEAIQEIEKQLPEAAAYLREHIKFDPVKGTVRYTGDGRFKLERGLVAPEGIEPSLRHL